MNRMQCLYLITIATALAVPALASPPVAVKSRSSDAALIRSAMSAAPRKVADAATVVMANKDGTMRTLRSGTGTFTCMPDNPTTPGPDPMCMDGAAMEWAHAWMTHDIPKTGRIGLMYMLEGGTDTSNTDPYAAAPSANNWVKTGPHLMIVGADPAFYAAYPRDASPDTSAPYVMWPDTPYQHLMVPVK